MTKFRKALKNEKGFTLIELLVVVVIIGVLSAIAVPNLVGASDKAKEKRVQADLRTIASVLETNYVETGAYPNSQENFKALDGLSKTELKDPWDVEYDYTSPDGSAEYTVKASEGNFYLKDGMVKEIE